MSGKTPTQFTLDILVSPKPSLDNFVLSEIDSKQAVGLIEILTNLVSAWESPAHADPELGILYIWGPSGSGKTHLLKALTESAIENEVSTCFLESGSSLWSYLDYGNMLVHRVYLIDNVDHLSDSEQKAFFRLMIEAKDNEDILIISTGSKSISGLSLRSDISSRLSSGLNFELHVLHDSEKIRAMNTFAQARGLTFPSDIAPWLMEHYHRDLPSLMSLIEALDHYSLQSKRAVNLNMVRELLKNKP
jgi:DnaA-homolog protein